MCLRLGSHSIFGTERDKGPMGSCHNIVKHPKTQGSIMIIEKHILHDMNDCTLHSEKQSTLRRTDLQIKTRSPAKCYIYLELTFRGALLVEL